MKSTSTTLAASEIIARFGDRAELGEALGLSDKALYQWEQRNVIPGSWHLRLLSLAEERGVALSTTELLPFARSRAGA